MNDIMREMFARDGMPQEIADMMIAEIPPEQTMWVISNEKGINCLLYTAIRKLVEIRVMQVMVVRLQTVRKTM